MSIPIGISPIFYKKIVAFEKIEKIIIILFERKKTNKKHLVKQQ
jgi:hypothetical protein